LTATVLAVSLLGASRTGGAHGPLPITPSIAAHVDAAVSNALKRQYVAGASLAIAEHGSIVYSKGYGLRDVDDNLPADANTAYHIGSITKQFTSAAIMLLQQQGKLGVNDRLSAYLPNAPHAREVTLRNLLSHTSGIVGYTEMPTFTTAVRNPTTPARIVATVAHRPLAFKPGTDWQYSNTNYTLLGMVVAKVSGEPYERFVTGHFLRPLGMTTAHFWSHEGIFTDSAYGYTSYALEAYHHADYWNFDWVSAAGGLSVSPVDLARWDIALDSGKVVSPASFVAMSTSFRLASGKPAGYGYGLGVRTFLKHKVATHTGGVPGFVTANWTIPADGVAIVLLGNGDNFSPAPVVHDIAATLYGTTAPRQPFKPTKTPPPVAARALRWLNAFLAGNPDFAAMRSDFAESTTPAVVAEFAALGKRLGAPISMEGAGSDKRPPLTYYTFRTRFKDELMEYDFAVDDNGKAAGVNVSPWYDY
jgi:CubicO group peptidase (beta-lactamase class C family)